MHVTLKVAAVHETTTHALATVKGVEMRVVVPCVEVELTNGSDSGAKLTFSGADVETAKETFKAGADVVLSF